MSARGVHLLNKKEPVLRQLIFELRYRNGFTYLDRCGKTLNRILKEYPEWLVGNDVKPQGAPLFSMRNGCRFVFNSTSCSLLIDRTSSDDPISQEEVPDFTAQANFLTAVVIDELALKDFTRIGFRVVYHFPCETKDEAQSWLDGLGVLQVSPTLTEAFEGQIESTAVSVVVINQDRRIRIAFNVIEHPSRLESGNEILQVTSSGLHKEQKQFMREKLKQRQRLRINTSQAAVVDFDCYLEEPDSVDPRDFISTSMAYCFERLRASSANKAPKT
jgi:hypothetical protein